MKELIRVDGASLSIDSDGTLWLAVVDGRGAHDTSLTDEGAELLIGALVVGLRVKGNKLTVLPELVKKLKEGK